MLANRLSADPSVRVLLLEAGPPDTLDTIRVPALWSGLFGSEVDWDYRLEPQPHYTGSDLYPRGKTLGGSSAINAMIYIRGHRTDFDTWSEKGCHGWDYDAVLPYFVKAESNSRLASTLSRQRRPALRRGHAVHPRALAKLDRLGRRVGPAAQRRLQRIGPNRCRRLPSDLP